MMLRGYTASQYLGIPPYPAVYLGRNGLSKVLQVVNVLAVVGNKQDGLQPDRPRSISRSLAAHLVVMSHLLYRRVFP